MNVARLAAKVRVELMGVLSRLRFVGRERVGREGICGEGVYYCSRFFVAG
jgi:hypothetical protein